MGFKDYVLDNPTLKQCFELGGIHAHYLWTPSPCKHWTPEQKDAYYKGFDSLKITFRGENGPKGIKESNL